MSEPKQAVGGEKRRGEGHVTLFGGGRLGHPHCPGTLIRNQRHGAATDVHTHTHVMVTTLLSVVNKRVRCTDYSPTHSLQQQPTVPAALGQHSLVARPPTMGQNMSMTDRHNLRQQVDSRNHQCECIMFIETMHVYVRWKKNILERSQVRGQGCIHSKNNNKMSNHCLHVRITPICTVHLQTINLSIPAISC